MSQDQFFPPIGQLAKKADDLPEELTTTDGDVQEDRPLEEVESLCMRCGEQVSHPSCKRLLASADS
jgi:zinc finger protein